ncbi:hypothetical protein [Nocardia alni]|uniref:hypothetical protein n=1 Tax=Nocardia alni TaxID=2815723 RepID=UPI0020B2644E|nr:hypothetical protein [Nocardia alni]
MPEPHWYTDQTIHETAVYGGPADEPDAVDPGGAEPPGRTSSANPVGAPQDNGYTGWSTGQASLRTGEIVVTTTEFGLPLHLRVDAGQLRREPADLAGDLMRLCRLAAGRAGYARRTELTQLGMTDPTLDLLGLPTQDAVEQTELGDEDNHEYEPRSWLDHDGSVW